VSGHSRLKVAVLVSSASTLMVFTPAVLRLSGWPETLFTVVPFLVMFFLLLEALTIFNCGSY
jgi:hypothetical protein